MAAIEIKSISDQNIFEFTKLKDNSTPENYFVAESEKVVFKLLNSEIETTKIFCTENYLEQLKNFDLKNCQVYYAKEDLFKSIIGFNLHQGIMALAKTPAFKKPTELDSPILILNAINKAENVGALVRCSTAFGFNSILFDHLSCSPYSRRSARVSMGNLFVTNVAQSFDLASDIKLLQAKGIQVVSAANEPGSMDIRNFGFKKDCAIIIGNEGHGISKDILKASDAIVKIPINPHVAHINASHAGAIFFYEYSQRFFN